MKQTLTVSEIAEQLRRDEYASWSYAGSRAMADWLDDNMPEESEFDRVAVRCEWSEHSSLTEWADGYFGSGCWADDIGVEPDADSSDVEEKIRDYINDRGTLIDFGSGIIVSSF
jgi:hypothetical protein